MIHKSMLSELVCWDNHNCLDMLLLIVLVILIT